MYSLSYEQNCDWTREYPGQEEILSYLVGVAQKYKIYEHVRFNTSVENAVWNDETKRWHVDVKTAEGSKDAEFSPAYQIKTDFLVSAVGQLNQPKWPEIDGIENFVGKKMHSARWDWSYDLTDKKIAVLGNGMHSPPSYGTIARRHHSNINQVARPLRSPPKSPKSPKASPSSNAHQTG